MRTHPLGKLFFCLTLIAILMFLYMAVKERNNYLITTSAKSVDDIQLVKTEKKNIDMKYVLQWTSPKNVPFVYMGHGQDTFIERKCLYTNCFVTADRDYLGDYTKFDAIAFSGPEVIWMETKDMPQKRSPHQKYAFTSIESSDYYPICSNTFDGFFNWTWSFRLDSESRWGYIVVRDSEGQIIGPNKEMYWMKLEDMAPLTDKLQTVLAGKTKTAAWFVSNCVSRSQRETFVDELKVELLKYELTIDVYGKCGDLQCSRDDEEKCDKMIEKDYHFYLALENSFSEDYVTEKLLHALEYTAIPIVYGGANYTRFMPEGIYLNAREMGVKKLAAKMNELLQDKEEYSKYFTWKNHYRYNRKAATVETDDYCSFCTLLNNEDKVKETTIYKDFQKWWDPPNRCFQGTED